MSRSCRKFCGDISAAASCSLIERDCVWGLQPNVKPIWAFPAKPWSNKHVWIGVCFAGMFWGMFWGIFRIAGLLTKGTLSEFASGYVARYVSGYVSEGSNMPPVMNS